MKTLVLFGSPRKNGQTAKMLEVLLEKISGEVEIIDAYKTEIAPCKDCRLCWKHNKCSIKDNFNEIYEKAIEADNIIVASPIYYFSLPAPLKTIIDRFQIHWARLKRNDDSEIKSKKCVMLLVGGANGSETQFLGAELILNCLFKELNGEYIEKVTFKNSDNQLVEDNPEIIEKLYKIAAEL